MAPAPCRIRDANIDVRPDLGCLQRDGRDVHLRAKTFQTLLFLLNQRHRVVSKEEIVSEVWRDTAVTDDAIVQCIVEIRKLLGDDAKQSKFIKTIAKSGYRFVGVVEPIEPSPTAQPASAVAAPPIATASARLETPSSSSTPRRNLTVPIAVSVAFIAVVGTLIFRSVLANFASAAADRPKIAVMFLDNQSKTAELDWLREGLTDMLVSGLSRSQSVSVVGREQLNMLLDRAGHKRDASIDLKEALDIAARARLNHVVLGSFAKLGNTIRIDLRLHDAKGGLVKTEALTIDSPDDLLRQVDLLSWRLAQHFGELAPAAPTSPSALTTNLEAYRYYSLGVNRATAFRNDEAVELFKLATLLDSEFAMAYARMGYTLGVLGTDQDKAQPFLAKAYSLGHRLSHKDRLQVESWNALVHFDYPSAATSLAELVRTYPMDVESYSRLGLVLTGERKYEEALQVFKRGLAVDPENGELWNRMGGTYDDMGRSPDAINARLKYVALQPSEANTHDSLGLSYQAAGRYDEAIATYQRALELNPRFNYALVHLGNTYVQTGQYTQAISTFRRYLEAATSDFEVRRGNRSLAIVELRRGRLSEALAFARKAGADLPLTITEARVRLAMGEPPDRIAALLHPPAVGPNRGSRSGERAWCNVQGQLAMKKGEAEAAIGHFRSGVQDRPTIAEPEFLEDILANAYLELGRYDEAIAEFERILKINPRYPLVHYRLGLAYEKKGQPAQARNAYEQFLVVWLKADRDAPEVVKARERVAALQ